MRRKNYTEATTIDQYKSNPNKFLALKLIKFNVSEGANASLTLLNTFASNSEVSLAKLTLTDTVFYSDVEVNNTSGEIKKFITNSKTLTELHIKNAHLNTTFIKKISEAIGSSKTLAHLIFNDCLINDVSISYLSKALKANKSVKEISLNGNQITDDGIVSLVESLKENKTLSYFHFENNTISNQGASALAELAKSSEKPLTLYLSNNHIEDFGAKCLMEAGKINKNFSFSLSYNYLSVKGVAFLKTEGIGDTRITPQYEKVLKVNQDGAGEVEKPTAEARELAELKAKFADMEKALAEFKKATAGIMLQNAKLSQENADLKKINIELTEHHNSIDDIEALGNIGDIAEGN